MAEEIKKAVQDRSKGNRVLSVDISVGALSGVVPESLDFCARTVFADAFGPTVRLQLHPVPATAVCDCGHRFELAGPFVPCPQCSGLSRKVVGGRDVHINFIEIDDGTEP